MKLSEMNLSELLLLREAIAKDYNEGHLTWSEEMKTNYRDKAEKIAVVVKKKVGEIDFNS